MATTRKTTGTSTTTRKPAAARKTPARKPAATPRKAPAKAKAQAKASPAPARTAHSASMAALGTLAAATLGALAYGAWRLLRRPSEGTAPTDLMGDEHPNGSDRAIDAFRPDPTAPVPASEREQFRPALAQLGNSVS
ncbi:hypothetical protein P6144_17080 [Sphingomonas sp. HITSZ_GF]|uniref:hypothetical protein n=1 Tax=Sphingomonas sp. HITSZ_GF TaxID=3037247 RepID=UPI00240DC9B1|nr:hypothetical protein [Sphingomonas sp. HITSZ_GF]MDG2535377.1 hypothetical protein [Sphingomonas sp. HITSZ_GF]